MTKLLLRPCVVARPELLPAPGAAVNIVNHADMGLANGPNLQQILA